MCRRPPRRQSYGWYVYVQLFPRAYMSTFYDFLRRVEILSKKKPLEKVSSYSHLERE